MSAARSPIARIARIARARAASRGFTLLEVLVVIAIVSIILGLSMNAMRKMAQKDGLESTVNGARALLRRARNASQEERSGATVEFDPQTSELSARLQTTITRFRFEVAMPTAPTDPLAPTTPGDPRAPGAVPSAPAAPDAAPLPSLPPAAFAGPKDKDRPDDWPAPYAIGGSLSHDLVVDGAEPAQGRYGQGLVFDREGAWARIDDRPALSPAEGLTVECWVYLGRLEDALQDRPAPDDRTQEQVARESLAGPSPRAPTPRVKRWRRDTPDAPPLFVVARKGRAWSISVTADYEVEVGLTGPHPDHGGEVTFVSRTAPDSLIADRWYRLALVYTGDLRRDGSPSAARLRVVIDGIPRTHAPVTDQDVLPRTLVRDPAPLILSDPAADACFFGVIDELLVAGVIEAQRVPIPKDVLVVASDETVTFDLLGQLDPARHAEPIVIFFSDDPRALEAIDPPPPPGAPAPTTMTRDAAATAAAARVVTDDERLRRMAAAVPTLERVRSLVIERTGLVRDGASR